MSFGAASESWLSNNELTHFHRCRTTIGR